MKIKKFNQILLISLLIIILTVSISYAQKEATGQKQLVKEVVENSEGKYYTITYNYDNSGNISTKTVTEKDKNGNKLYALVYKYSYKYNPKTNTVTETVKEISSDFLYSTDYVYDERDFLIKKIVKNETSTQTTEYTYNDSGRIEKEVLTNSDGSKSITTYEYDKDGFLVLKRKKDSDGSETITTIKYAYDKKNDYYVDVFVEKDATTGKQLKKILYFYEIV